MAAPQANEAEYRNTRQQENDWLCVSDPQERGDEELLSSSPKREAQRREES